MLSYYATLFTFGTNSKHFVDKNSGKLLQSDACSKIFWVIAKEDICNGRQWLVYLFLFVPCSGVPLIDSVCSLRFFLIC